jgi:hypothetical protein
MPQRLHELGPQHHAAIRMKIEGVPTEQICERLDVEKRTVYLWFSDPLVKTELQVQLLHINATFAERLAAAGAVAFEQLTELAAAPVEGPVTPQMKLELVREILDRIAAHPTLSKPPPNPFEGMSTAEITERVQEVIDSVNSEVDESADGSPLGSD